MEDGARFRPDPSLEEIIRRGRPATFPSAEPRPARRHGQQGQLFALLLVVVLGLLLALIVHSIPMLLQGGQLPQDVQLRTSAASTQQPTQTNQGHPTASLPAGAALTVATAASWCAASGCSPSQFGPLVEANGSVNPSGLKFQGGGICYTFWLPEGVEVDYWDSAQAYYGVTGPITLARVCEASFRT